MNTSTFFIKYAFNRNLWTCIVSIFFLFTAGVEGSTNKFIIFKSTAFVNNDFTKHMKEEAFLKYTNIDAYIHLASSNIVPGIIVDTLMRPYVILTLFVVLISGRKIF